MTEQSDRYAIGDWIVHQQHGIGRLTGTTRSAISGEEARYYILETARSSVWVPADQLDGEHIRPLSTPEEMQAVVELLKRPPRDMDDR